MAGTCADTRARIRLTVTFGAVSYTLLEQPLLKLKDRFRPIRKPESRIQLNDSAPLSHGAA
jgi:peptidoglycan/LPS O-acetylase OafA/YrhL